MDKKVELNLGSGGRQMQEFISEYILGKLGNKLLNKMDDASVLNNPDGKRLAFTTDSYVVNPLFFDGGDIGRLAVCGTVNDLATSGAKPLALSLGLIIEDGLSITILSKILDSIAFTCNEAEVSIVTGDTKVVEKGKCDGVYINTAGVGLVSEGINISSHNAKVGDSILVTGTIGEHELAIMKARGLISFDINVKSDVAPLNKRVENLLKRTNAINVIKDPTRGGLATALHEIANNSKCEIKIFEKDIPVSKEAISVCDILGLDPIYLANEGKYVIVCPKDSVNDVLTVFGSGARVVGTVVSKGNARLYMETVTGGFRRIGPLESLQVPRIC